MKILYYSPHPALSNDAPTGYAVHIKETIDAFRNAGHDVMPVIMGNNKIKQQQVIWWKKLIKVMLPGIIRESLKDLLLLKTDKKFKKLLIKKIEHYQPDLIYERDSYLQNSGILAAIQTNTPHFLEINAPYIIERADLSGKSYLLHLAEKKEILKLNKSNKIFTVSTILKKHIVDTAGVAEHKIKVTPNGINPDRIKVSDQMKQELIKKYSLSNKIIIGFAGSFFPWHRLDLLLNTVASLKGHKIQLLIVGSGQIMPELKGLSRSLNIAKQVTFTGAVYHEDIFNYIDLFDIAVMPGSNWYGSPVKIFEYGVLGKAVIAPDTDPVKEIITNKESGILIKPDIKELQAALHKFINDKEYRESCGEKLKSKILTHHTWHHNAKKILKEFE